MRSRFAVLFLGIPALIPPAAASAQTAPAGHATRQQASDLEVSGAGLGLGAASDSMPLTSAEALASVSPLCALRPPALHAPRASSDGYIHPRN